MKLRPILIPFLLFAAALNAQVPVTPVVRALLCDSLPESSGIEYVNDTAIWSHNDSGHPGNLYRIDTTGAFRRVLHLKNVVPSDIEDLARDSAGWFYIGDFGNNANSRHNLRIFKIPPPDTISSDSIVPQVINFSFADQDSFPPSQPRMNFDCEAMFHFHNHLYVFSKNRGSSTFCRMYILPDTAGTYSVMPVDSFDTQHWVTSADISPDGSEMALFSEYSIFIFTNFSGDHFFQGNVLHLTISPYTQKEGMVFATDSLLYITDEKLLSSGGKLYSLDISTIGAMLTENDGNTPSAVIYPNPSADVLQVSAPFANFRWVITDSKGTIVLDGESAASSTAIECASLSAGLYYLRLILPGGTTEVCPVVRTR
jgi:hypothetical protein